MLLANAKIDNYLIFINQNYRRSIIDLQQSFKYALSHLLLYWKLTSHWVGSVTGKKLISENFTELEILHSITSTLTCSSLHEHFTFWNQSEISEMVGTLRITCIYSVTGSLFWNFPILSKYLFKNNECSTQIKSTLKVNRSVYIAYLKQRYEITRWWWSPWDKRQSCKSIQFPPFSLSLKPRTQAFSGIWSCCNVIGFSPNLEISRDQFPISGYKSQVHETAAAFCLQVFSHYPLIFLFFLIRLWHTVFVRFLVLAYC